MLEGLSERERALAEAALAEGVVGEGELRVALASGGDFGSALRQAAGARAWQLEVIEEGLAPPAATPPQAEQPAGPSAPPKGGAPRWELGEVVAGYTLVRHLGSGGMGEVFLVEDSSGARYALKTLARSADPALRARFQREGEAQARADGHPNVLRVRHAAEVKGEAFLLLDLASGGDLSDRIAGGPLSVDEVFELGIALAGAIEHAHSQGVLHRDLKPSNILFDEEGVPKVCDFGLAALEGSDTLTKTGAVLGTPRYMAPEQADATRGEVGEHTDVYALGAVLFTAVTGRPPFVGEGRMAIVSALLLKEAPRARSLRAEVPAALDVVLEICLRKEPEGRFSSARDLREALEDARRGVVPDPRAPGRRRRSRKLLVGLALVSSLGSALWAATYALREGPPQPTPERREARIDLDDAPEVSYRSLLVLRGKVSAPGATKLRVGEARPVRIDIEGRFRARVNLAEGKNQLSLEALSSEGEVLARLTYEVVFMETPRWWRRLSEARRPALPLPKGLRFGEEPGTYRYREGSILVWVPPGKFTMGRPDDGFVRGGVEGKQEGARNVEVTLTRGYFIGKYEVSWGLLDAFLVSAGGRPFDRHLNFRIERTEAGVLGARPIRGEGVDFWPEDDYPAHGLNWVVADDYTRFYGLRLPTEAEWEYAARGQQVGDYPWGDMPPNPRLLNCSDPADGYGYTAPVNSFPEGASPFGCLHMAGNVAEFTSSCYAPYPEEPVVDWPGGPGPADYVVRGWGFIHSQPQMFTVYNRWAAKAIEPRVYYGFRVALSHDPQGD